MKNSSGDSRILDFVNSVSLLCPLMFFSYFGAWHRTNSTHCARYAISNMESLILKSSLLRPLVYIKWKAWRHGNNMLNKHMNCLTRRATDQLWLKNLHRYSLISKQSFCIGNGLWLMMFIFQELGLGPSVPLHVVLKDWIRHSDGNLSFLGFIKLLHGVSSRTIPKV